jgi:hypothetical protein
MSVRLFNDIPGETQTSEGKRFDRMITEALRPIIDAAVEGGVCLRELDYLIGQISCCTTSEEILRRAFQARQNKLPKYDAMKEAWPPGRKVKL